MTKPYESLDARPVTYAPVGATAASDEAWGETLPGFRRYEQTAPVAVPWGDARSLMLRWGVKTRSGFVVSAPNGSTSPNVVEGASYWLRFRVGPVAVTEPVRVIAVVDEPLRCGFAYATLDGHPVSGEEAFVISRCADRAPVLLTIRSLTQPAAGGFWRYTFPVLLAAQQVFRRRYLRSLNATAAPSIGTP